jgi:cell fate (sporulation/competence/biofilm development) regulator YmcA (YheA/YmcA/DUF963 family)
MSKSKYKHSTLSGLIESDTDDAPFVARDSFPTPDSAAENQAPEKKGRGRPKAAMPTKVTKAKAPARRISGRLNAKLKELEPVKGKSTKAAAAKGKRRVLADKTNQQEVSDTEEVDEFKQDEDEIMGDELDASVVALKQAKPKETKKKAASSRGKTSKEAVKKTEQATVGIVPEIPATQTQVESRVTKNRAPAKQKVIPETQVQDMDVDDGGDEEDIVEQTIVQSQQNIRNPRSISRTHQPPLQQRRAGSNSDTERSDPALRRKLGDITKKFDSLNVKYQDLREIGLKEAERNFERLKKLSEEKTAGKRPLVIISVNIF